LHNALFHRVAHVVRRVPQHARFGKTAGIASDADNLVIRIFSFSFIKVCPKDESATAAASFSMREPAQSCREDRFKPLTGRDAPVIDYLNRKKPLHQFRPARFRW